MNRTVRLLAMTLLVAGLGMYLAARAQTTNDVANTPHNLSVDGPGTVTATSETQICIFCHTPHGATNSPGAPLWNRALSGATYTTYSSSSLDAETIAGHDPQLEKAIEVIMAELEANPPVEPVRPPFPVRVRK